MSNPYELRFKVLEMARDLEMEKYNQLNYPFWQIHNELEILIDKAKDQGLSGVISELVQVTQDLFNHIPSQPTPEAIKNRAAELYEFVERKPGK